MDKAFKGNERLGEERLNNQGCLMKIIEYNKYDDIIVEFQDEYCACIHTSCRHFKDGDVRNPYYPQVYNIGITGNKYPARTNGKDTKEYKTWTDVLKRCFDKKEKQRYPTYKKVTCCDEWLLFEKFYEWLHKQPNFDRWLIGGRWAIDKDILIKGNKIYSPDTCCLVPENVNALFNKHDAKRGKYPIGVNKVQNGFQARCMNPLLNKRECIGIYPTPEKAFYAYKQYKEKLIKQVAQIEFDNGNITKECYEAMMNYEVEITD